MHLYLFASHAIFLINQHLLTMKMSSIQVNTWGNYWRGEKRKRGGQSDLLLAEVKYAFQFLDSYKCLQRISNFSCLEIWSHLEVLQKSSRIMKRTNIPLRHNRISHLSYLCTYTIKNAFWQETCRHISLWKNSLTSLFSSLLTKNLYWWINLETFSEKIEEKRLCENFWYLIWISECTLKVYIVTTKKCLNCRG